VRDSVRERLVALAPRLGYPLFYLLALTVFATLTFPFGRVKDRIVVGFNADQRASGSLSELSIDDLTSSWLTGVKLTGVHLTEPAAELGKPPSDMKVDSLVVRVGLLPLIAGNHDVTFHASAFGGTVEGSWIEHGKDVSLDATLEGLDVAQISPIAEFLGAPAEGSLDGSVSLELPEGKVVDPKGAVTFKTNKANGTLSFDAHDLAMGDGKSKVRGALAIPRLNVGAFSIAGDVKDGTVRLTKIAAGGKDVEFAGDGRVLLRDPIKDSAGDFNVRFKVNDAYRSKTDATKSLFGAPGSAIPGVIDLDPRMKQSKRLDGFYTWHGKGPLTKLDFSPGGTGGPGGAASTPTPAVPGHAKPGP
jgi:type II secretion system protein N